jgi:FAD dependent oxidoreductase TIGR03364
LLGQTPRGVHSIATRFWLALLMSTPLTSIPGTGFAERRARYDLVVVGAGIIGLGHAYEAHRRGLTVAVVDRAATISGASIRNFGHVGVTGQSGAALAYAEVARSRWQRLAVEADFWLSEAGAIMVARADDEYAVLEEFTAERGKGASVMLSAERVAEYTPVDPARVVGGAWLPQDVQVDPRSAAPRIAEWLGQAGIHFFWCTTVTAVTGGTVYTNRGEIATGQAIVAVNHDVDGLYPEVAAAAGLVRCSLDMMSARATLVRALATPLLTGWSMVRYSGFAGLASTPALRSRLAAEHPELAALDLNQMYTQRMNGDLIIGDTHASSATPSPFQSEPAFEQLVQLTTELFGTTDLRVHERWQGVYAKADEEFLVESPEEGVTVVSVTTGIGMTTGLGVAASVMEGLFAPLGSAA